MKQKMFLLLGCISLSLVSANAAPKLNVVATTPDLGALAREIGGDRVEVTTLARPTEDPHFVDAKPSFIVKLSRADALVEGGAELEIGWLPPLIDGSRNSKLENGKPGHISAVEGIPLLEVPSALDRSKGDIHAAGNPHYSTDPINGKLAAVNISRGLSQIDPGSADLYKKNYDRFAAAIDAKMPEWTQKLAPFKGQRVVSYHNSWPYFAKRFDLRFDLFLEPKPGIPPTPAHLAEVITAMKSDQVKVIVVEPYLNRRAAETVVKHAEAKIIDIAPYPGVKSATESYIDWMNTLVNDLAGALGSKP